MYKNTETLQKILVINLKGSLDSKSSIDFYDYVNSKLSDGYNKFIVNCERLSFLSSSGISIILRIKKRLFDHKGVLIYYSLNKETKTILRFFGLDRHILIADDKDSAKKILDSIHIDANTITKSPMESLSIQTNEEKLESVTKPVNKENSIQVIRTEPIIEALNEEMTPDSNALYNMVKTMVDLDDDLEPFDEKPNLSYIDDEADEEVSELEEEKSEPISDVEFYDELENFPTEPKIESIDESTSDTIEEEIESKLDEDFSALDKISSSSDPADEIVTSKEDWQEVDHSNTDHFIDLDNPDWENKLAQEESDSDTQIEEAKISESSEQVYNPEPEANLIETPHSIFDEPDLAQQNNESVKEESDKPKDPFDDFSHPEEDFNHPVDELEDDLDEMDFSPIEIESIAEKLNSTTNKMPIIEEPDFQSQDSELLKKVYSQNRTFNKLQDMIFSCHSCETTISVNKPGEEICPNCKTKYIIGNSDSFLFIQKIF